MSTPAPVPPSVPPSGPFTSAWWNRTHPLPGTADMAESERLLERAVACPTKAEAIRLVASYVSPGPAYMARPAVAGDRRQFSIVVPRHESGYVLFRWRYDSDWNDTATQHSVDLTEPEALTERLGGLLLTLTAARMHGATSTQQLQIPDESLLMVHRQNAGALAMWWDERIREGQTVESAQFLLSLILSPAGLRMVEWPEPAEGMPVRPQWRDWPVTVHPLPARTAAAAEMRGGDSHG